MTDTDTNDFIFGDILPEREEPATIPSGPVPQADEILGRLALQAALDGPARRRLKASGTLAMVIGVPSPAWVGPIHAAAAMLGLWDEIFVRPGTDRAHHSPDRGNEDVAHRLSRGGRILGIAPRPSRHLPSALMAAADLHITVQPLSPKLLRRAIKAVTGGAPRQIPASLGAGLDATDLCAAIRAGSTPGQAVRRLQAATRARTIVDPALAEAPRLEDLHGYGAAMTWSENLVRDLDAWRQGAIPFEAIDRCCVWAGPPGCGKTTLARAVAREAGLPLLVTSVPSWFTQSAGYLDSVLKEWQRTVAIATALQPCFLFLDELDALPGRRTVSDRNRDFWTPLIAQILLDLDSASSGATSRLIIVGATNDANRIDEALIRPGRLNRVIHIGPPDIASLAGIMRSHLGPTDLADTDLRPLAQLAVGATGANVAQWVKGARRRARLAGRAMVVDDLIGEILPPDPRSPESLRRVAVHEAAHACVSALVGAGAVHGITILDHQGGAYTATYGPPDPILSRADVERLVLVALAGRAAEEEVLGSATSGAGGSAASDLAVATQLVAGAHMSFGLGGSLVYRAPPEHAQSLLATDPALRRTIEQELAQLYGQATALVRRHRKLIEIVADALTVDKHMSGPDFERLFSAYAKASKVRVSRTGGRHE